jgi:hypothetical protein
MLFGRFKATVSLGLTGHWTNVTGGMLEEGGSSEALFTDAEVATQVMASSCPGDTSPGGTLCPGPGLTLSNVAIQTLTQTQETNNLTLMQQPVVSFPNADLVTTEVLMSTNGSGTAATCVVPDHLFIKDNNGDNGGTPSNSGGVPFWESPDIFILPSGAPALVGIDDTSVDVVLTAGAIYDVYLRVNNDGCRSHITTQFRTLA